MNQMLNPDLQSEIAKLEAEYAENEREREKCQREARSLMEREAAGEGVFAAQIFGQKQKRMVLTTQMQHLRARINRLKLGLETV